MERTRTYECMCLLDNREVRKGWDSLKDAVAGIFTKHEAKVLSSRRWDERRLAYPIEGQIRATYLLVYIAIDTQNIPMLRRDLQFSDSIIRYMITECADVPAGAYEPEAEFDVNAIPEDDAPDVKPEAPAEEGSAEDDDKADDDKADDDKADDDKADDDKADDDDAAGDDSASKDAGKDAAEGKADEAEAAPAAAADSEEKE